MLARAFDAEPTTAFDQMVAAHEECLRSPEHAAVMNAYRATQAARRASADVPPDEPAKGGAR